MMKKMALLAMLVFPRFVGAETITFEADSEILVLRGFDSPLGVVQFDILGSRDGTVLCVAIDGQGNPLATTVGFTQMGHVSFMGIELEAIERVACRYNS
jgi:hypothetical protein